MMTAILRHKPSDQLSFDQVTRPAMADRFAPATSTTWLTGLAGPPPWMRFTVRNSLDQAAAYYVQIVTTTPSRSEWRSTMRS